MKNLTTVGFLIVLSFWFTSFGNLPGLNYFENSLAQKSSSLYTNAQIESFIREVFAEHADELVLKSSSGRKELIVDFLKRFSISLKPEFAGKKFPLLSGLKLQNKYNSKLTRDDVIDVAHFNPLKYNFPMMTDSRTIFRVDRSDYIIIIEPAK